MPRQRKIRPGHRIVQMIWQPSKDGNYVSYNAIYDAFLADPDLKKTPYKISGYVNDILKYDLGAVHTQRDGRKPTAYRLLDWPDFDPLTGQSNAVYNEAGGRLTPTERAEKRRVNRLRHGILSEKSLNPSDDVPVFWVSEDVVASNISPTAPELAADEMFEVESGSFYPNRFDSLLVAPNVPVDAMVVAEANASTVEGASELFAESVVANNVVQGMVTVETEFEAEGVPDGIVVGGKLVSPDSLLVDNVPEQEKPTSTKFTKPARRGGDKKNVA